MSAHPVRRKPRIAVLSNHFSGAVKLEYLHAHGCAVDTIVTIRPEAAKKARVAGYFDFRPLSKRLGFRLRTLDSFKCDSPKDLDFFRKERFDLLVISGWQRLVPAEVLRSFKAGAVAEHGSADFLPRGRGRSPINWSIIEGRERFVLHLFFASPEADAGPVIDYEIFDISPFDNLRTMFYKVGLCSGRLLLKNLDAILSGAVKPKVLANVAPTYYRKREEKDDTIDWARPTKTIYDHVRAITHPYPLAKSSLDGRLMTIAEAVPFDSKIDFFSQRHGEILFVFPDRSFLVKTGDGSLLVTRYDCAKRPAAGKVLG